MTATPLQALVMLNDPQVLEASRVFAERIMSSGGKDEEKLREVFRKIVCREPSSKEKSILLDYLEKELEGFRKDKLRAMQFISVGEYPRAEKTDPVLTAAWMQLIHTIYNLDESGNKY